MLKYFRRFKNTGTIMALVGLVGLLLNQFGTNVDLVWLNDTTNIVCSILIVLGICNNPDTNGVDLPTNLTKKVD